MNRTYLIWRLGERPRYEDELHLLSPQTGHAVQFEMSKYFLSCLLAICTEKLQTYKPDFPNSESLSLKIG